MVVYGIAEEHCLLYCFDLNLNLFDAKFVDGRLFVGGCMLFKQGVFFVCLASCIFCSLMGILLFIYLSTYLFNVGTTVTNGTIQTNKNC